MVLAKHKLRNIGRKCFILWVTLINTLIVQCELYSKIILHSENGQLLISRLLLFFLFNTFILFNLATLILNFNLFIKTIFYQTSNLTFSH